MFYPSPDVNAEADSFIARFHDGWRLEGEFHEREAKDGLAGPIKWYIK